MPDCVRDGTPLSLVDTAWLHMEDPTNLMMVTRSLRARRPTLTRLRLIKERMDVLKRSPEPLVSFQMLSALGLAPREVAHPLITCSAPRPRP